MSIIVNRRVRVGLSGIGNQHLVAAGAKPVIGDADRGQFGCPALDDRRMPKNLRQTEREAITAQSLRTGQKLLEPRRENDAERLLDGRDLRCAGWRLELIDRLRMFFQKTA